MKRKCLLHRWRHQFNNPGTSRKLIIVSFSAATTSRTCAKALINFSGLFKLFNSLPLLGFLLPNRIFQKIEISQKPSFVGNFRWNEGVIKGFWTFTYGQIGLWKFFFFMIFFRFECNQDCWRKGLLPQARLEPTPLKFRVSFECH